MTNYKSAIGQQLLDVPMGDMIRQMATAIADAQLALDKSSIDVAAMMGGHSLVLAADGEPETQDLGPGYTVIDGKTYRDTRVYFGFTDEVQTPGTRGRADLELEFKGSSPPTEVNLTIDSVFQFGGVNWRPVADTTIKTGNMAVQVIQDAPTTQTPAKTGWTSPLPSLEVKEVAAVVPGVSPLITRKPSLVSMLELGFAPTFYQFVDTIIEVKIAIKITVENTSNFASRATTDTKKANYSKGLFGRSGNSSTTVCATQVDASYSQKYNYSAEGSSLLRTKLVPIPPPAILEERVRALFEANKANPKANQTPT